MPVALLLVIAVTACGGSSKQHVPDLSKVPLVPGAKVVAKVQRCDPGASAYCAIQLVVIDSRYRSSTDLLLSERAHLHAKGWTGANGDVGPESAADSPGHKLHLTYAPANNELLSWDAGWIKRAYPIVRALSNTIFDHQPALSLMLEVGAQG